MKTSRVARETAKLTSTIAEADYALRRQTRSAVASLQTFTAQDSPLKGLPLSSFEEGNRDTKCTEASSELYRDVDIEDLTFSAPPSHKRKRNRKSPDTLTSWSAVSSTRPARTAVAKKAETCPDHACKTIRRPAKRIAGADGEITVEAPLGWEEVYRLTKKMREARLAPVDTMGCESLAEEHMSPMDKRFQTLIALMLSSQTKDTTNAVAMRRLQTELPRPGLTLQNILDIQPANLNEMIYVVGFHNTKTKHIKAMAEILRDEYSGDIPGTIEGLMSLPGVGPKMAYLCMSAAWGRTEGIGVDVHVHRITNLWRWHQTKTPEETRMVLQSWLPRDLWHDINHLLVGFGQTICTPVARKCGECTLSERRLCPSVVREKNSPIKRVKKVI